MDYQTTLAREDDGEISLSGLVPCGELERRRGGDGRRNCATAGEIATAFEVGLGSVVEADASAGEKKGKEGNAPVEPESEGGRKGRASPDAGTAPSVGTRDEREIQGKGGETGSVRLWR